MGEGAIAPQLMTCIPSLLSVVYSSNTMMDDIQCLPSVGYDHCVHMATHPAYALLDCAPHMLVDGREDWIEP